MAKRCRCGEEIEFIEMQSGTRMPVESKTPETYYLHQGAPGGPQMVIVTLDGTVIRGRLGKQTESGVVKVEGYESHFARCSSANTFRRSG